MPFSRPTLTQLRQLVAADLTAAIPGADGLLRFSNIGVMGSVTAGVAYLQYGYLDWIAKQSNPFTATDEFLEAWAALVGIIRLSATFASGTVTFTGNNGVDLPNGNAITRGDGVGYVTTADESVSAGTVTVPATATVAGAAGNCVINTVLTLANAIAGIQSGGFAATAFQGGADVESDDSLRARMLERYQNPPQGGAEGDYETWALQVNGITRVWVGRNGQGTGTVVLYFMMDVTEEAFGGFPQGTNGCATEETRDSTATGDQLALAEYIWPLQPVTALVYAVAPVAAPQAFTIASLSPNTAPIKAAISAAITDCFLRLGNPLGTVPVPMASIEAAIEAIDGIEDFIITSPTTDIITTTGQLPTLGVITYV